MSGRRAVSALVAALLLAGAMEPAAAQSTLDRTPNLDGPWASEAGVGHFHLVHRFWVTERGSKVINSPTLLGAIGLGHGLLAGFRYGSNSMLSTGPNEWEAFGRWRVLDGDASGPADVSVGVGWNGAAGSVDGELAAARSVGPLRVHATARAFSAFTGAGGAVAVGGGAAWRVHRNVALAGDVVAPVSTDTAVAWGVGLQLRIPTTPHTVSLHATNVNVTTLQGSSFGSGPRRAPEAGQATGARIVLYGFEFTVPVTFARYAGGAEPEPAPPAGAASDTAVVGMDNRLRFLPDTVRIRVGQAVRWENTSDLVHTVTADPALAALPSSVALPAGASSFHSGDMAPGAVYVRVFETPGAYQYFCVPHERAGMTGVVLVEGR